MKNHRDWKDKKLRPSKHQEIHKEQIHTISHLSLQEGIACNL